MLLFDGEFDYCEADNLRELTQKAVALFVSLSGGGESIPSGDGDGETSDLPWVATQTKMTANGYAGTTQTYLVTIVTSTTDRANAIVIKDL